MCDRIYNDKNCHIIILDNEFIEETAYIYILLNNSNSEVQIIIKESANDKVEFQFSEDGYYTLCTINITTNSNFTHYYKDNKLYYNGLEISLLDLIEENPDISGATINYESYFNICNLRNCYYKVCKEIINSTELKCSFKLDKELLYKRDLLLIALSTISYLTDMNRFDEAQYILNRIEGCNGLCETNKNCGCNGL